MGEEVTVPELVGAIALEMPLTHEDCSELAQRLLTRFEIRRRQPAGASEAERRKADHGRGYFNDAAYLAGERR